ncbi:MAG TPA: LamG-like jellyroll fold domain-containing protein [Polyangia bacterium]
MAGMFLVACGDGTPGTPDGGGGAGGKLTGTAGAGGGAKGGAGGLATGTGGATTGVGGAETGGSGGATAGAGGTSSGGAGGTSSAGAGGTSSGGAGGALGGAGGGAGNGAAGTTGTAGSTTDAGATDAGATDAGPADAGTDAPPPAAATTIPAGPVDFGPVDCGSAGGSEPFGFTNSGNAVLHYRASITPGGIFSLQGAAADGSVSGDLNPNETATLHVLAGVVPTTSAAGAVLTGAMAVATNAAGADNAQVALQMTASGSTCTLTCGSFTKCTPSNASPYCANTATDNANCGTCGTACGAGEVCVNGGCALTCGALTKCSPSSGAPYCANTTTDSDNCGTCGNACGTGQVCQSGVCTLSCGALTKCSPSSGVPYCANTMTDNANCGTCGTACTGANVCSNGLCTITCGMLTTCTPSSGSPYCANTTTDNANCGTCGNACTGADVCTNGACTIACGALSTCTPSSGAPYCANLGTDNANCGTCGTACGNGQVCSGGVCTLTCGSLSKCTPSSGAAYCANLATDGGNCGTCGTTCTAGQSCMGGLCQATCSASETACGGLCTNTSFDPSNCGTCGTTCAFSQGSAGCAGGMCFLTACNAGYGDCNHQQADGCESNLGVDAANCGACGKSCALGETCQAGTCTANLSSGLVGYWKMDDAAGSTSAADSGPNGLPARIQGSVTFVPGAGKQGSGAVSLGGAGYLVVQFPNDARHDGTGLFIPQGNISFSMWFKTATSGPVPNGLQVVEGNNYGSGCDRIVGNGAGSVLQYNDWSEVNMSGAVNVNDGNWHLMTYVLDEVNGLFGYVDGALDVSSTSTTSNCGEGCSGFNWADQYWIGSGAGCRFGAGNFSGLIDDVRFYDHVLSPTAVLQLYNSTK